MISFWVILLLLNQNEIVTGKQNDIKSDFSSFFPGKNIVIDTLEANDLRVIINTHLDYSPEVKAFELSNKAQVFQRKSMESSLMPSLFFDMNTNGFSSYRREVVVEENVPIEWDEQNPIVSNIELPNGGQGLIWLPRPTAYGLRDIPLNASEQFFSTTYGTDMGMSYKFPFGLEISNLGYSMNWRQHPKTYGFPWNASVSTALNMPLFRGLGFFGDQNRVQLEIMKIDEKISDESLKMQINSIKNQVAINFFQLHIENQKLNAIDSLTSILKRQKQDVDFLTEKGRVTLTENLNIKSSLRNLRISRESSINTIVLYSSKLNLNTFKSDNIYYYKTDIEQMDILIDKLINRFYEKISPAFIDELIAKHPNLTIQRYDMEQARINLRHAENMKKPQIDLNTNFGVLEANQLGYGTPLTAAEKVFTDPDNYTWRVGFQYSLPVGNVNEYQYLSMKYEADRQHKEIEATERSISDALEHYIFSLKSQVDNIKNYKLNLDEAQQLHDEIALPLYEKKRLNNFDYYSYLSQIQNAKMSLLQAKVTFLETFFEFASDMNIYVDDIINELE